jgi:hypothetical protein
MNIRALPYGAVAATLNFLLLSLPASAQVGPFTLFVASTGDDSHGCSNPTTDACKTFARAVSAALSFRLIVCVDSADFGQFTIDKTITIDCTGTSASSAGITINGSGIVVAIRGLVMNTNTIDGILFQNGAALTVENSAIRGFKAAGTAGIKFTPSASGSQLFVSDTTLSNNGISGISGGIVIKPASGIAANVTIERTRVESNFFGIVADGTGGGTIRGVVRDSVVSGNINNGITVSSSGTSVVLAIDNTTVANNNFGLVASGTNSGLLVRRSFITANATGLFTQGAGLLYSYRDNSLNNNSTDGAFTGVIGLQ